jgi:methyl-accepting chemotaxis protein
MMRLSLYQKIIGMALAILLFAGVIITFTFFRKSAQDQRDIARILTIHLLNARLNEKDFLTRKKSDYARETEQSIRHIDSILQVQPPREHISHLSGLSREYLQMFTALKNDVITRGLDENSGVEGAFRKQVHAAEDATKQANQQKLLADMYLCRRHEKDFVNRGAEKYVVSVRETVATFLRDVEQTPLAPAQKELLRTSINEYLLGFENYVKITKRVNDRTKGLQRIADRMGPAMQDIIKYANEDAQWFDTVSTVGIILSCIAAIALALVLAQRISKPLEKLTKAAQRFARGESDVKVSIRTGDEIERLAASFNTMIDNTQAAMQTVQAASRKAEEAAADARRQREESISYQQYLAQAIQKMLFAMGEFSFGDLTVQLDSDPDPAIDKLFRGFNDVVANIRNLTAHVVGAARSIAEVADTIAANALLMAESMQRQQSQATEIAAAIGEINHAINESSEQASLAAEESNTASTVAARSGSVMQSTLANVGGIAAVVRQTAAKVRTLGESSEQISEIVSVIDEIADQTNLLALNAAIEAARAGDQGRGFAVVADEVRKLAERTQQATREISTMIQAIQHSTGEVVKTMTEGANLVRNSEQSSDEAGSALQAIIEKTSNVATIISRLASVSEMQSAASTEIASNVARISEVTHQTAVTTEEIARISEDLKRLTDNLQNTVQTFRLEA